MNRDTGNVLLVLLGGAIVRISVGDTYLRYVKPALHIPLILAGTILIMLGLLSLWRENPGRRAAAGAQLGDGGAHGHDHAHGSRMAWLLLIPVFAIFLIAPPALGSYAADRSTATRLPAQPSSYPPLPAGDPVRIRLDEFEARAAWDAGRSLADRRFVLTGFVTIRPAGGYYLTRLVISCCAADAVAVRVAVTGGAAGSFPRDTWIEVVGRYDGLDHSRESEIGPVANLRAESVRQVPAPREPYET